MREDANKQVVLAIVVELEGTDSTELVLVGGGEISDANRRTWSRVELGWSLTTHTKTTFSITSPDEEHSETMKLIKNTYEYDDNAFFINKIDNF